MDIILFIIILLGLSFAVTGSFSFFGLKYEEIPKSYAAIVAVVGLITMLFSTMCLLYLIYFITPATTTSYDNISKEILKKETNLYTDVRLEKWCRVTVEKNYPTMIFIGEIRESVFPVPCNKMTKDMKQSIKEIIIQMKKNNEYDSPL